MPTSPKLFLRSVCVLGVSLLLPLMGVWLMVSALTPVAAAPLARVEGSLAGAAAPHHLVAASTVSTLSTFSTQRLYGDGYSAPYRVVMGDLNGDGFLDLIVGEEPVSWISLNDGAGNFPWVVSATQMLTDTGGAIYGVAVGDLNGDSALDIVLGGDAQNNNAIYFNRNDGTGRMDYAGSFGVLTDNNYSLALGDMNGDGHLDIVAGNLGQQGVGEQSVIYLNNSAGGFHAGNYTCGVTPNVVCFGNGEPTNFVALGDLDGNGRLDIVQANDLLEESAYLTQSTYVYLNLGAGVFSRTAPFGGPMYTGGVALGDVNGDGSLDIVAEAPSSKVYLNDGAANFSAVNLPAPIGRCYGQAGAAALGDLDGDGDLDLASSYEGGRFFVNDGVGNFGGPHLFTPAGSFLCSVILGDVNNDNFLDIVTAPGNQSAFLYLNDGNGQGFIYTRPVGNAITSTLPNPDITPIQGPPTVLGDLNADGWMWWWAITHAPAKFSSMMAPGASPTPAPSPALLEPSPPPWAWQWAI